MSQGLTRNLAISASGEVDSGAWQGVAVHDLPSGSCEVEEQLVRFGGNVAEMSLRDCLEV